MRFIAVYTVLALMNQQILWASPILREEVSKLAPIREIPDSQTPSSIPSFERYPVPKGQVRVNRKPEQPLIRSSENQESEHESMKQNPKIGFLS